MKLKIQFYLNVEWLMCHYTASTDAVELLLHSLLDRSLFFECDEYESPPLFCLWILWKLNGLDLCAWEVFFFKQPISGTFWCWWNLGEKNKTTKTNKDHTSPKVPKYSWMTSFEVSGLRPPTKTFLTGSFFIAKAFLGSITLPSNLCSFCARTLETITFWNTIKSRSSWNYITVHGISCFSTHLLYTGCIFKENEAKASWPSGRLVHLDGAVCHLTKFVEVIFEIFLAGVPAESADKHFPKCRRAIEDMFSIHAKAPIPTLHKAAEWGWGECTHCSRTSVDPMTYGGQVTAAGLTGYSTLINVLKVTANTAGSRCSVSHTSIHVWSDLCPSAHPPLRSANGANKGRLNKETRQTTSAYPECRLED